MGAGPLTERLFPLWWVYKCSGGGLNLHSQGHIPHSVFYSIFKFLMILKQEPHILHWTLTVLHLKWHPVSYCCYGVYGECFSAGTCKGKKTCMKKLEHMWDGRKKVDMCNRVVCVRQLLLSLWFARLYNWTSVLYTDGQRIWEWGLVWGWRFARCLWYEEQG